MMMRANQDSGLDEGASLAVTLDGQPVVDLWAGYADAARTIEWTRDTLVCVFSTSKIMVTIPVLMLWDQGLLDLDAPISHYWPEFARNGKATITARQVMTHTAGLPGFGRSITAMEFRDWTKVIDVIENAEPWYEPGTISCYHAITYGFILGELIHRISGRPFAHYFAQEVARPLDADFHFGITDAGDRARVAGLFPAKINADLLPPIGGRLTSEIESEDGSLPGAMATVSPATLGIGNARSMARIGSVLTLGGELDGRRYLSRDTVREATREQLYVEDLVFGPMRRGLGVGLHSVEYPAPTPTTFHWGGFGGSFITMDSESGITCGYAPNRLLVGDGRPPTSRPVMGQIVGDRFNEWWRTIGDVSRALS
jgi:CubicO group peptidase (beta-lactamase class C family)